MPGKGSTCTCLGVAAAKVPVKRYNLLVPAIYPTIEPSYDKPFNMHTEKALKKLMEYLERNEHRIPKVGGSLLGCVLCQFAVGSTPLCALSRAQPPLFALKSYTGISPPGQKIV